MAQIEQTEPVWNADAKRDTFATLREDLDADVCVVGAGIVGMSVAYHLAREGKRVVVLDDGPVGGGQTGLTTGHLASAMDDRFFALEEMHGVDGSRLAYQSHQAAVDRIGEIAEAEGIDCDYRTLDGFLFLAAGDGPDLLRRELDAAHRAGFADAVIVGRVPGSEWDSGPCIRFPRQARFHILKYLHGLARAIHSRGGHIFTGTHVSGVEEGDPVVVRTTDGRSVRAASVVVATNSPVIDRFVVHTKQAPYLTYAIGATIPPGAAPDALIWDTGDPYYYVRIQEVQGENGPEPILIVGGEDVHTGEGDQGEERFRSLEAWTRHRFPIGEVRYRWSGQVFEPVDYLGYIGRNPGGAENVYIATGDSGQGLTHGTIAGMLISDLVLGRENPWVKLYDPSRITLRAAKEFARTNLQVAGYYAEWVTGVEGEVETEAEVAPGCGAVIRRGTSAIAVYRDESGQRHELSAVCPHLGCIVHWNDLSKSWDCPCHGSRFEPTGAVLNGPSIGPLNPVKE